MIVPPYCGSAFQARVNTAASKCGATAAVACGSVRLQRISVAPGAPTLASEAGSRVCHVPVLHQQCSVLSLRAQLIPPQARSGRPLTPTARTRRAGATVWPRAILLGETSVPRSAPLSVRARVHCSLCDADIEPARMCWVLCDAG
eukprot:3315841-Rhodomonas_salina.3